MDFEELTQFEKGLYLGMAYSLLSNTKQGERQLVTGQVYRDSDEAEDFFLRGDFVVPKEGPQGWQEWTKFSPDKFYAAFYYLYSGDEPNVSTRYQLYDVSSSFDHSLMIEIRTSEDEEPIPEGWGLSLEIHKEDNT